MTLIKFAKFATPLLLVLSFIFLCSLIFNLVSLASIVIIGKYTATDILVLNLAISDIIYSIGIPFYSAHFYYKNWIFGLSACRLFFFTETNGMICSVLTVSLLSLERCLDVTSRKGNSRVVNKLCSGAWVLPQVILLWAVAAAFVIPFLVSIDLVHYGESGRECSSDWSDRSYKIYLSLKFAFVFILPYLVIVLSSVKLLWFLRSWGKKTQMRLRRETKADVFIHLKRPSKAYRERQSIVMETSLAMGSSSRPSFLSSVQVKATRIVLAIVLAFLVQWSPLWLFQLYLTFNSDHIVVENVQLINFLINILSYSNCCLNPILFLFLSNNFKLFIVDKLFGRAKK